MMDIKMNSIYRLLAVFALIIGFISCEDDRLLPETDPEVKAPEMLSPLPDYSKVIHGSDSGEVMTFVWSEVHYGVSTPVGYTVTIDTATNNFANEVVLGSSDKNYLNINIERLNDILINRLGLPANEKSELEVRVTSNLTTVDSLVSDAVVISITPYMPVDEEEPEPVDPPERLWVPGDYQGWDPAAAPTLRLVGENLYEGYVYISMASGFKFTSSPDWDHINYGDSGTPGELSTDGLDPSLGTETPGYYRFIVNTADLTYQMDLISSWGLIGTATPGIWDNSTPMTFDAAKEEWTVTQDLVAGALKFRANNAWDINLGPADSNAMSGRLINTDGAISIPSDGNYTITIDLNTTDNPYDYTYKVVKN
ncbi:SusE domain-containing protein [Fulvivirga ligni]|uniref:SusE domain-containing protein n=1 Tax=Fulvivirga ligni TaxID=2904246 RepID=UPI001F1B1191|nr:SusE domain-containing protein [Fulvivirga ligni]UII21216.1 SusE domain-containing protein [Fulvivirga ligni]